MGRAGPKWPSAAERSGAYLRPYFREIVYAKNIKSRVLAPVINLRSDCQLLHFYTLNAYGATQAGFAIPQTGCVCDSMPCVVQCVTNARLFSQTISRFFSEIVCENKLVLVIHFTTKMRPIILCTRAKSPNG